VHVATIAIPEHPWGEIERRRAQSVPFNIGRVPLAREGVLRICAFVPAACQENSLLIHCMLLVGKSFQFFDFDVCYSVSARQVNRYTRHLIYSKVLARQPRLGKRGRRSRGAPCDAPFVSMAAFGEFFLDDNFVRGMSLAAAMSLHLKSA
jgi:hypothetical protein